MIKSIKVTNFKQESLELELTNPQKTGLAVYSVTGLGPPQASINYQELATADGGIFSSARTGVRNVVLTLAPLDFPSVEENRLKVYQYFPSMKPVRLTFFTDKRILYCDGYVESNDPDIWSELETIAISILCPDPWFYAPGDSASVFSGVTPLFEFPFANESLKYKRLEFGNIMIDTRAHLQYEGDIDAGLLITIHALDVAEDIVLFNVGTHEQMKINTTIIMSKTNQPFGALDDIIISTKPGDRYIRLRRNGIDTNIIYALDRNSDWMMVSAGDNVFGFDARNGANNLWVTYSYRNAYGGI